MKKWLKKLINWFKVNLTDKWNLIIFIIVFLVLSVEVWGFYLAGLIIGVTTDAGKWCIGIASACWLFWLGPFTPFVPICLAVTLAIRNIYKKIKSKKE